MRVSILVLLTVSFSAIPVAVSAQAQLQTEAAVAQARNPNEVVCEKQEVTGSRLGHRKVCMTRSQWEDARRQDRSVVEKVQTERGMTAPIPGG
jgi:invasion protein IalB